VNKQALLTAVLFCLARLLVYFQYKIYTMQKLLTIGLVALSVSCSTYAQTTATKKVAPKTKVVTKTTNTTGKKPSAPKALPTSTKSSVTSTTGTSTTGPKSTTSTTTSPTPTQTQSNNANTSGGKGGMMDGAGSSTPTSTSTSTSSTSTSTTSSSTTGTSTSGGGIGDVIGSVLGGATGGGYSQGDAANAIKDALLNGITNGVKIVSVKDGYFGNSLIKIPFPTEAQPIVSALQMVGAGSLVDKLVLQINRSAEDAAVEATPIFVNSIKQLTISDAVNIVSNQQSDAATQFLKRTTNEQLVAAFRPKIKGVLDKTMTTQLWSQIMGTYNQIPFVQKINPDLTDFVTRKALDGLFVMVAKEEAKIRKDPMAQTTDILKKVFGKK
jgi:hypothetical protein